MVRLHRTTSQQILAIQDAALRSSTLLDYWRGLMLTFMCESMHVIIPLVLQAMALRAKARIGIPQHARQLR